MDFHDECGEMKKERDHRLKTDPIGYRNAKPAMKEEAEQIDEHREEHHQERPAGGRSVGGRRRGG